MAERRAEAAVDRRERPHPDDPRRQRQPIHGPARGPEGRHPNPLLVNPDAPAASARLRRGGALVETGCMAMDAGSELVPELRQLAILVRAAKLRGDDNYILRRGAILHADVAILAPRSMEAPGDVGRPSGGLERFRMEISDGQEIDLHQSAVHWEIARMLLDFVRPRGVDHADPGRDEMVRQWYRATAAWMQLREDHDKLHLDRARAIFPADPDILFLSACQHETYAGAPIQTAVRSAILPTGVTLDVGSERVELREAEGLFRRLLEIKSDHAEARLRYGRVLGARQARRGRGGAAPRGRRPHRPSAAVLRRTVSRRRGGGARQPRRRAGGIRTGRRALADGAVAAAGAQPAGAALRRSQRRASRDRAVVRASRRGAQRARRSVVVGTTSCRGATRTTCSRPCSARI